MQVQELISELKVDFFAGVPDSQLNPLCNYLMANYGIDPKHHVIAANEGNCAAIAAGYHLATGKVPMVYMQNSGEGNIINPAASLLDPHVYGIPVIYVIGWRGEPGVHDEPQHVFQGAVTVKLLDTMEIPAMVVSKETSIDEVKEKMIVFREHLAQGRSVAFVIRKGAFQFDGKVTYQNDHQMKREEIIRHVLAHSEDDLIVSTTGKASREVFELREAAGQGHGMDFLTVGSMGHASSIALGIAAQRPDQRIWCIDGDGAALMHMGAMAVIGATKPKNLIHVVINNGAHETVGGMPTVAGQLDLTAIARACGYASAVRVSTFDELDAALAQAKQAQSLCLIEALCAIGARDDLGRPTTTAMENKLAFMETIAQR